MRLEAVALAQLEIRRVVRLTNDLAEPLIERLKESGAVSLAGKVAAAASPSNPMAVQLDASDWKHIRTVLDSWSSESPLHPRLRQLRQFVEEDAD